MKVSRLVKTSFALVLAVLLLSSMVLFRTVEVKATTVAPLGTTRPSGAPKVQLNYSGYYNPMVAAYFGIGGGQTGMFGGSYNPSPYTQAASNVVTGFQMGNYAYGKIQGYISNPSVAQYMNYTGMMSAGTPGYYGAPASPTNGYSPNFANQPQPYQTYQQQPYGYGQPQANPFARPTAPSPYRYGGGGLVGYGGNLISFGGITNSP